MLELSTIFPLDSKIFKAELLVISEFSIVNTEYLEDVARKTEEIKLKNRELDLREREIAVREREADIREASARAEAKWWNSKLIPTALSCLTVAGINLGAIWVNNSEFPLKNGISQWMQKPNIKL